MKNTKKRGVTLVEMIMAMVLMAMVGIIVTIIFNTAFSSRELIDREVSIQSDMRNTMQTLNNKIEGATGIFVLDESKYKAVSPTAVGDASSFVGTAGWNYIGLSDDGTKLMVHIYDAKTSKWVSTIVGTSSPYKMTLDLTFTLEVEPGSAASDYQDNRLLKYDLSGKYDKGTSLALDTAIMALNTKQIFSRVAKGKEGIALAYRNDPIIGNTNAAITFVFDVSGSMAWDLEARALSGGATNPNSRMAILKAKAKEMMQLLSEPESVSVNFVTFSTTANYTKDENFTRLTSSNLKKVEEDIDSMGAAGVTNPGDGLRYGLVALKEQPAQNKYVVILSDGRPNRYNVTSSGSFDLSNPLLSKGTTPLHDGNQSYHPRSVDYVRDVAKTWGKASGAKNLYFIGFSGLDDDRAYGQTMTNLINANGIPSQYEEAKNSEQLNATFRKIVDQVIQDLWFVNGP